MHQVIFSDTTKGIESAVAEIFNHAGGAGALLKSSRDVFLKPNAVDMKKNTYTNPEVLRAVIRQFQQAGAKNIYVVENCTQGNITRLVFEATGMTRVCRETGALPVYLDETGAVPVYLEGLQSFIDISAFIHERLIQQKAANLYVSLPKLKTHSMSQVTFSIKNQFGLVHHHSRVADHNFRLHQKFADIYRLLRPDFVVIDGLIATNHGHYTAEKFENECIIDMNCLIGGSDPLAVDIVAAAFLGYKINDVLHIRLSADTGISTAADPNNIEIRNRELFEIRRRNLTHHLLEKLPADLKILRGRDRCCMEGCRGNTEAVAEILYNDHKGRGDFTILMGKGIDPAEVDRIEKPPVHLAGSCAIQAHANEMRRRFGKKNVTFSHGCNNLSATVYALCRHMRVNPISLANMNPVKSLALLARARLNHSKALIPPLL